MMPLSSSSLFLLLFFATSFFLFPFDLPILLSLMLFPLVHKEGRKGTRVFQHEIQQVKPTNNQKIRAIFELLQRHNNNRDRQRVRKMKCVTLELDGSKKSIKDPTINKNLGYGMYEMGEVVKGSVKIRLEPRMKLEFFKIQLTISEKVNVLAQWVNDGSAGTSPSVSLEKTRLYFSSLLLFSLSSPSSFLFLLFGLTVSCQRLDLWSCCFV